MRLIKSENMTSGQVLFYLPEGVYSGLFVTFKGTNVEGNALLSRDLGYVKLNYNGQELINVRSEFFIERANLLGGSTLQSSIENSDFTFTFFVPFRLKKDSTNVLVVAPNSVSFILSNFSTNVVSGTIDVYAVFSEGVAKYLPYIKEHNVDFAGASTKQVNFTQPNIEELYILNPGNISRISVLRDGKLIVDSDLTSLQSYSNAFNMIEDTTYNKLLEVIAQKNEFTSGVKETQMTLTTSSAIFEVNNILFYIVPFF